MRLLRVIRTTDAESGGPFEALLRTSEVMLRAGHEVEVVSLESSQAAAQRVVPFPITALGPGVSRYGYNPRLAPWITQNAGRFDAVILHGLWNYSSFGAWRALRHLNLPYFIYTHGMMDPWFRDQYPLKHMAKQLYWWVGDGRVLRDAQAVLFTSEEEKERARHVFRGYRYKERVVLYGTADPDGDPEAEEEMFSTAFPALNGRRFLLFISRIHPKKGLDILIEAFARCSADLPPDIGLVIAGPDQVGMVQGLKQLAVNLGVGNRVHFPGMLKGKLKWGAVRSAEAMILPSHQENFGVVVAEAMACSTPVLISDKVNIWREVRAAGAGLVEPDTVEGVRDLLLEFYALSAEERTQMGIAARQGFLRNFKVESAAHDLMREIGFLKDEIVPAQPMNLRKKRLLHVIRTTNAESGGPLEALVRISGVLVKHGIEVEVLSLESTQTARGNGLPFPVTGVGPGWGRYGFEFRLVRWLTQNAARFDAVILHGLWNYSSFGSWLALRKLPVPYFIFVHGMMDPWFREAYPLKHYFKRMYWKLAEHCVLRDAKLVLFTCEEEKMRARNVFFGHSYKERVVQFGTSDPNLNGNERAEKAAFAAEFPQLANRRFLLFLGRIHPKKGCDMLIQAFAHSIAQLPDDTDLVIAGPDQMGLARDLIWLAKHLGISHRVHLVGMLKGEIKWGAFRSAEAIILPSHQENFGVAVAETLGCSIPVLISDKVNIWREVQETEAGLVEPDTLDGTRNLISRFFALTQPELRQMRMAARRAFLHYFDAEAAGCDLMNAIGFAGAEHPRESSIVHG